MIKCDSDITLSYYVCGRNSGDKNSKGFCQTEFSFTGNRKCTLMAYDEVNGIIQNKTGPAVVMNIELTGTKDAAGTNKFCKINILTSLLLYIQHRDSYWYHRWISS